MLGSAQLAATVSATAIFLAGPALGDESCIVANGIPCDAFLDAYVDGNVPTETDNANATEDFLVERYQDFQPEAGVEVPSGDNVLYWDGDSAMIVPEEAGPRLEIADW